MLAETRRRDIQKPRLRESILGGAEDVRLESTRRLLSHRCAPEALANAPEPSVTFQ